MSRLPVLLAALLLTALLAGCSGGGGGDDPDQVDDSDFEDLDLSATSSTGVIRGVVVDDAIRPIAGARLSLPVGGAPRTATSSDEGLFGFDGLEPGTYFVSASKPGYLPAQTSVEVVAGVRDPPIVRILLGTDTSFRSPYYEQYTFEGFIECSTGVSHPSVGYAYYSACSGNDQLFPNDKFATSYVLTGHPEMVQSEMVWDSTQAVSESLSHNFYYEDDGEQDGYKDLTVEGPSPLVNTMDAEVSKEYVEGLDYEEGDELLLQMRMFTTATDGTGAALTIQQRFTVYTTIFYGYTPPGGWRLMDTGEVPPPPA
jgi:hypothetical protein